MSHHAPKYLTTLAQEFFGLIVGALSAPLKETGKDA